MGVERYKGRHEVNLKIIRSSDSITSLEIETKEDQDFIGMVTSEEAGSLSSALEGYLWWFVRIIIPELELKFEQLSFIQGASSSTHFNNPTANRGWNKNRIKLMGIFPKYLMKE